MQGKAKNDYVTREELVTVNQLPRGEYSGLWSGYEVEFVCHLTHYKFATVNGVRGINVPVVVVVNGAGITFETTSKGQ